MTDLINDKINWTLKSGKEITVEIKETPAHDVHSLYSFCLRIDGSYHSTSFETIDGKDCYKELRANNIVLLANKVAIFKPEADKILNVINKIEAKHVNVNIIDKKENICPKCETYCYGDCTSN